MQERTVLTMLVVVAASAHGGAHDLGRRGERAGRIDESLARTELRRRDETSRCDAERTSDATCRRYGRHLQWRHLDVDAQRGAAGVVSAATDRQRVVVLAVARLRQHLGVHVHGHNTT